MSVLRSNIEILKSNGVSLMPEGLEKNVNRDQMADLLSFLKNWRVPRRARSGQAGTRIASERRAPQPGQNKSARRRLR
ncbi:MAG: hypothetical protein Ct9H300mP1_27200 [Planctomycetaceae bacterium]|nr:MAG: hypothetical protein Ct9H300mP1_27200 [Planctomycetaceae bacterium]